MFDSHAVAEALLGSSQAITVTALVVQTRAKRALGRTAEATRQEADEYRQLADTNYGAYLAVQEETGHLVKTRLPALVDAVAREYPAVVVPGLGNTDFKGSAIEGYHEEAEALVCEAVQVVREAIGRASRAGVRAVADEAQTFLVRCQIKIFAELDKYPRDSKYHQGLMDLDHLVTRALHTVQRLRILAGSWPGIQRADCTFREIVESARGRIDAYQRVEYSYLPHTGEVFVEGRIVEPVTVALAELMANATAFSSDRVAVSVQEVQTGYCIVVEDNGVGLNAFQRTQAERLLSQSAVMDTTNLRDDRKLGFAVIGRLAHEYGFHTDVSAPSAGGGVRAVLRVPSALLGSAPRVSPESAQCPTPVSDRVAPVSCQLPDAEPTATPTTATGLPKRQPRQATSAPRAAQLAVTDTAEPGALAAGLANLGRVIQSNWDVNTTEGDHPRD